ncbi:MAG TPA: general secretion pathway protein GspB [Steroidobacteraceae bacterium]|jgi:general secretion pathway protein B|nr:general secretion pathway protein GspB [Steroidobacteraceae bacterium]
MSFILDALKKSENERQRQVGPSLADVQVSRRRADKPWWVVAVGALLVLNLGVLLVVLMRDGDARSSAPPAASQPAATNAPATDARPGTQAPLPASASRMPRGNPPVDASTNPAVHALSDEAGTYEPGVAPDADPQLSAAATVPEGPPMVRPIEAPSVAPAAVQPAPQSQLARDQEVLPTPQTLAASGTALPDMHLDIHVYAPKPADRFVFVNMRKYTEGQALKEGPTLERITPDGAILNQHGLRFLLPRQ